MYVYYYRTYEKAVSGGGEREKGGHVLRDTTSRGLKFSKFSGLRFENDHDHDRQFTGRGSRYPFDPGEIPVN